MEPKKYPYSTFRNWYNMIVILGLAILFLYIIFNSKLYSWYWFVNGALFLCLIALIVYMCWKYVFPLLRNKTALELDKDKLQFYITDKTVYWSDVKSISYRVTRNGDWIITFAFKNESKNIFVSTQYIAGDDKAIYDTITEYFEKVKT